MRQPAGRHTTAGVPPAGRFPEGTLDGLEPSASLIARSRPHPTPAFWLSAERVHDNLVRFGRGLPDCRLLFPVRANADPRILAVLGAGGARFGAASLFEIRLLADIRVEPDRIAFTAPIKRGDEIEQAARAGVRCFSADSPGEVEKLAKHAPGGEVLVAVRCPGGAERAPFPCGADPLRVPPLLREIARRGMVPRGLALHVGPRPAIEHWSQVMHRAAGIFRDFHLETGLRLSVLHVGSGLPRSLEPFGAPEMIFAGMRRALREAFGAAQPEIWVEADRAIVDDAAVAVTTVIGRVRQGRNEWLFCDLGAFNGLPAGAGDLPCEIVAPEAAARGGRKRRYIVAGPSCSDGDVLARGIELPEIRLDDRLCFLRVGAYSFVHATAFSGNRRPVIHVVD